MGLTKVSSQMATFDYGATGSINNTLKNVLRKQISVFDFIPENLQQDIVDGVSTTDVSSYVQNAIDATDGSGGSLWFPHGTYCIGSELTVTGTWRRFYSTGLAVGLPGAQLKAITRGITTLNANMQTVAIENISFVGFSLATITGSINSGSDTLTVSTASAGYQINDVVSVAGAGVSGAPLVATISNVAGTTFTLNTAASTSVTNASVTYDPRGTSGSIGVILQQSSGATQQDDARITNCWFAGFAEAGIKAQKVQGCHILDCTFEYNGAGIKSYSSASDLIFYQNIVSNCRFYRNLRGIYLGSKTRANRYLTDVKWNTISNCVFDFNGRLGTGDPDMAGISFANEASYNVVTGCQFANQYTDDVLVNQSQGNSLSNCQFHRPGAAAIRLQNADDTVVSNFWVDNANNAIAYTGVNHSAIEANESTNLKLTAGQVFVFGVAAMLHSINLTSNSTAISVSGTYAAGTSTAVAVDGSSSIVYGQTA